MMPLSFQHRSDSNAHNANINAMRTTDPDAMPITDDLIRNYKPLSRDDIQHDPMYRQAPIAVPTNQCRHQIIMTRLKADAIAAASVILAWQNPLAGRNATRLSQPEINLLYETHPRLMSFFLPGAPCFLMDNINPA